MIASETIPIRLKDGSQCVTLAPFTADDVDSLFPLDDAALAYTPSYDIDVSFADADKFWDMVHHPDQTNRWGIFDASRFVGVLSMADTQLTFQEIGTFIAPENARYRGIGTLAKLGGMWLAFAKGAVAMHATTTTENTAARRSLYKAGFTSYGPYGKPTPHGRNGAIQQAEYWYFENVALRADKHDPQLHAGRQRYQMQLDRLIIER